MSKHNHEHGSSCTSHNHEHGHDHSHGHGHSHSKLGPILFFIGLALFFIALFISGPAQSVLFVISIVIAGYHVIFEGFQATYQDSIRLKKFTPNVHILMTLAATGALILGDYREAALLILIFAGAHFLEDYAQSRSTKEITNLLNMNPTQARRIEADGSIELIDAAQLRIGDSVRVLNGDQIPADGSILEGFGSINESSITGESMPQEKSIGDTVFASTINDSGSFVMRVDKDTQDSVFSKIIQMVSDSQQNISKTAVFIKRLEPIYVTAVLIIAPLFFIAGRFGFGWTFQDAFYKTMVFLTVASPCALAATDIPATLSAISNLAKRGVLFKGGAVLSNLSDIQAIAFDKTGTLTEGKPSVTDFIVFDETQSEFATNMIVAMEQGANHPLAQAILSSFKATDAYSVEAENSVGKGLTGTYDGVSYTLGKLDQFTIPDNHQADIDALADSGKTVIGFGTETKLLAVLGLMDLPNAKAQRMLDYFKEHNIETYMITGDAYKTGVAIASQLGISNVYADVLPEHKADTIKQIQAARGGVAMVGDGVNDAVALVQSDVGIAMGDGTDVAIDVADGVLMQNNLDNLAYTHALSKKLRRIVIENIIFAMGIVLALVIMNIFGAMNLPLGVVIHEGSTLVVIINGLRLLKPIQY